MDPDRLIGGSVRHVMGCRPIVWRVRVGMHGWVREVCLGGPIVTGRWVEAQQWLAEDEALAVMAGLPSSMVPCFLVPGPPAAHTPWSPFTGEASSGV